MANYVYWDTLFSCTPLYFCFDDTISRQLPRRVGPASERYIPTTIPNARVSSCHAILLCVKGQVRVLGGGGLFNVPSSGTWGNIFNLITTYRGILFRNYIPFLPSSGLLRSSIYGYVGCMKTTYIPAIPMTFGSVLSLELRVRQIDMRNIAGGSRPSRPVHQTTPRALSAFPSRNFPSHPTRWLPLSPPSPVRGSSAYP